MNERGEYMRDGTTNKVTNIQPNKQTDKQTNKCMHACMYERESNYMECSAPCTRLETLPMYLPLLHNCTLTVLY